MDSRASVDPMFLRVLKKLSSEAQDYLHENGLSDPGVFESFVGDPSTELQELAFEPGDIPTLQELLQQAHQAARGQRAEFAHRGADEFIRRDKQRREEARSHEAEGPSELQRAIEAPPPWHCRRLPSRLARSSRLEGDSRAREKAEKEEKMRGRKFCSL